MPAMAASRSRCWNQLSETMGFELLQYPVGVKEMQNQSSQWLNVRRDRPDYMIMWGWGAMNPTAVKEAAKIRYPMDKFIGVWWSGVQDDAAGWREGAKGYKAELLRSSVPTSRHSQDIKKHVIDAGKSQVDRTSWRQPLQPRPV
jgi:branched-chain amino acid transport system substrate-binding protein